MMKKTVLALVAVTMFSGCASGLNSVQKREYEAFKHNDVLVKEKEPATGAVLGILPGGGSFYARSPVLGVTNLLLWPLSILWDPISGSQGSQTINYDITKQQLRKQKQAELSDLDARLARKDIELSEYVVEKGKIEDKYSYD